MKFQALVLTLILLGACKYSPADKRKDKIDLIVCTTSIIADCVRQIAPENIKVIALMGAGVDPHMYKALPKDLDILDKADIVIINGLHLEAKLDAVFRELKKSKSVIAVGDGVPEKLKLSHGKGAYDPHIWFDLDIWKTGIHYVSKKMKNEFPTFQAEIETNWIEFQKKTLALQLKLKIKTEMIPLEKRILITSHDAFSYFGKSYGFNIRAVQGMNTMIEAGLNDNQSLIQFVIENKVSALFIETSVSSKSLQSIKEACKYRNHKVKLGEALCSDALGPVGSNEASYFGMLESNIDKIVKGLR